MFPVQRRLYLLLLRLHPAAFRNRFAREMALDFEDALATYGFAHLLLDATRSLARQWTVPAFSARREQTPIPQHPLLAGQYLAIDSDTLTPFEIFRGSLLFLVLMFALNFAANVRSNHRLPANVQNLPVSHDGGLGDSGGDPTLATPGGVRGQVESGSAGIASATRLHTSWQYMSSGQVSAPPDLSLSRSGSAPTAKAPTWAEFLLRCALISAILWLTSFFVRRSRTVGMRMAWAALGLLGVLACVGFVPGRLITTHAQVRPQSQPRQLAFDVISIREDKSLSPSSILLQPMTSDGYHYRAVPIYALLQEAYAPSQNPLLNFRPRQVIGAPDWLTSARYDIDAKVAEADLARWNDPAQQPATRRAMLQALLADRLKLVTHRELRTMPIFELALGKSGPKFSVAETLTPAEIRAKHPRAITLGDGTIVASGPNPGQQTLYGVTMPTLAWFLTNTAGRPVVDKTGLLGKYDLSYQLELLPPDQQGATPPDPYSLQIRSIVEDQLGLKLTSTKGPVEVLVIDHIERPTAN